MVNSIQFRWFELLVLEINVIFYGFYYQNENSSPNNTFILLDIITNQIMLHLRNWQLALCGNSMTHA